MRAVAIVGTKKTGKTATGLALTRELQSRGLKVAVVKHTQHHFDKQGTDTDRYRELGATVIGVSADETMMNWPSQRFVPDLLPLADADVLVMEGGRSWAGCRAFCASTTPAMPTGCNPNWPWPPAARPPCPACRTSPTCGPWRTCCWSADSPCPAWTAEPAA